MICAVVGCGKAARCRGWCSAHYERWRRNGDPGSAGDARKRWRPVRECSIDGCVKRVKGRGWCVEHYSQWRTWGDPTARKRVKRGTNRRVTVAGYVEVYEPGHPLAMSTGYVLEHRKVAWDAGVLVDPADQVHHLNRDRQDNRVENLEAVDPTAHARLHAAEAGRITNQYGTWPIRSAS